MPNTIRALFLGDIVGKPGCRALFINLKNLIKEMNADIVIANAENAAEGFGITPEIVDQLVNNGVDVITSGNHIWQKREIIPVLEKENVLLRPYNYPDGTPGTGVSIMSVSNTKIAIVNLLGRQHIACVPCPFLTAENLLKKLSNKADIIFFDFHAETVIEKEAFAYNFDGEITGIIGTHTHVQTADEKILPKGTAYISDIGMTGPENSIIGMQAEEAIQRSLTQIPIRMSVADNPASIHGVVIEADTSTGKALSIKRFKRESKV